MRRFIHSAAAIFTLAAGIVAGANQAQAQDNRDMFGTIIGAAIGGLVGSNMGSGDGKLATTAAGTVLGAVLGRELAVANPQAPRPRYTYPRRAADFEPRPSYGRVAPPRYRHSHGHRGHKHHRSHRHHSHKHRVAWKRGYNPCGPHGKFCRPPYTY